MDDFGDLIAVLGIGTVNDYGLFHKYTSWVKDMRKQELICSSGAKENPCRIRHGLDVGLLSL